MGVKDEQGRFRVTDRRRDMIVVSGFKVFPNKIEDVLALHPGVLESTAIGVADERTGEAVKVLVVRRDAGLEVAKLLVHRRQHLTGYKVPGFVEFRDKPLPKTAIGKVLRRSLRDEDKVARGLKASSTKAYDGIRYDGNRARAERDSNSTSEYCSAGLSSSVAGRPEKWRSKKATE